MGINIEVTLNVITCHCGALYAVPHWTIAAYYNCPFCNQRKQQELNKNIAALNEEILRKVRVINGLRGALKRKKNRRRDDSKRGI